MHLYQMKNESYCLNNRWEYTLKWCKILVISVREGSSQNPSQVHNPPDTRPKDVNAEDCDTDTANVTATRDTKGISAIVFDHQFVVSLESSCYTCNTC